MRIQCSGFMVERRGKSDKTLKYDNSVEFRPKTTNGASMACHFHSHVRQSAQALAHVSISSRVFNLRTKKMPIILITKAAIDGRKVRNKSQTIRCVAESKPTMTTPSQKFNLSSARPVISGNYTS